MAIYDKKHQESKACVKQKPIVNFATCMAVFFKLQRF